MYLFAPTRIFTELGDGNANGHVFSNITGGATLQEAVSYLTLASVAVSGGLLNVTGTSVDTTFNAAGLAGMQLVGAAAATVPLPAGGLLLSGLGFAGFAARRKRA